jgi:hypothetical protein
MKKIRQKINDEIDLIKIMNIFTTHKNKYIILALIGFLIGLGYTYKINEQPTKFETSFTIYIAHPAYTTELLMKSASLNQLVSNSLLNPDSIPNFKRNNRKRLFHNFSVITETVLSNVIIEEIFKDIVAKEVSIRKDFASKLESLSEPLPIMIDGSGNNFSMSIAGHASVEVADVIDSIKFSFSKPNILSPHPLKYSAIGVILGLFLSFLWMLTSILKTSLLRKTTIG